MRVAIVLATSAGGVGGHVRSVVAGLVERGAHVAVLGPASTDELFGFAAAGARFAPVEIADRPHPVGDAHAIARIRRLTRDADVVHAHGLRAGGLAALALARAVPAPLRTGVPPLVVTLHNAVIAGGMIGAAYATLERVVARGATEVLGVSPDLEERMRSLGAASVGRALVPAPPRRLAENGVARSKLRADLGAVDRPLVVVVARLAEQKGLPLLLDASAGWARRTPPPLVAVAGDGPLEESLRARIESENLPVRLLGRRSDVPELLSAADVAVVSSVWEGQPLIVQEVLRAGRPLVATEVGGIPGMVGEAALLVPSGDAAALEAAVLRVLNEPDLAERLASAAAEQALRLPTEEDAIDQLTSCYARATGTTS
ncbi:glycosyltransferase family 4 protein [Actinomadura sp. DC4]|uniref:glycosyltransferase family 4 protein n=1 Tax=Actinomadura sp. DC4 TaxID=3055069 RepID=UPI0025B1DAD0|nr:glycosyltransferase family 4 protein [Actinomadura sp. DC4]MDN3355433.1 glycosyltransferase family 4 protein [Actinomadura sp. DC4]